jgi:hypothetical protein
MNVPIAIALLFLSITATAPVFSADSHSAKNFKPEGYRIVSYDAATHQWVILRNGTFDGKYLVKRIAAICSSYKLGNNEALYGPEVCHLQVGRMIISNPLPPPEKRSEFLDVFEMPDQVLSITEGFGAERVQQQFKILKYEVLPDK